MTVDELRKEIANWDVSDDVGLAIFADWLEEQGEDEWAYLARLFKYDINEVYHEKFFLPFPSWLSYLHPSAWPEQTSLACFPHATAEVWKNYERKHLSKSPK